MGERTTLAVSKALRDRLRELGRKGDTYEEIIRRLMRRGGADDDRRPPPGYG